MAAISGLRVAHGVRRARERVALGVRGVEVGERAQVGEVLDALAADRGAGGAGERDERLEQGVARRVAVGAVHERAVDLEDVGRDADQLLEPGVAGARVVERHARAACAQLGQARLERLAGREQLVLGELDHHVREVVGQGVHRLGPEQRARADVEREERAGRAAGDGERGAQRQRLELGAEAAAVRLSEPLVRAGAPARRRSARAPRSRRRGRWRARARAGTPAGSRRGRGAAAPRPRRARRRARGGRRGWRRSGASAGGRRAWRRRGRRRRARAGRRPPGRPPGRWRRRPSTRDGGGRRAPRRARRGRARRLRAAGSPVDAGEHEHELLAAEPADGVAVADDGAQLRGRGGERLVALRVTVRVVDLLEVVEVEHDDAERAAGGRRGLDLAPQALLRTAVVEQAGEAVRGRLLAQVLALARRLVRERGHRGEALDERDLGVGEAPIDPGPVDVQRADDAVMGQQWDADERLVVVDGARDDGADVVEACVRHIPRAAVADDPAGGPGIDGQ